MKPGSYEWSYEPGFSFEVTHATGKTPVAMEVGLGLKPNGSQLMFMVKATAPKGWVALSGDEVRLLDGILEFFEAHRVYFAPSMRFARRPGHLVVCSERDYEPFIETLTDYASLSDADEQEAQELLEKSAARMTKQAFLLAEIITTFVDEASMISEVGAEDQETYPPEGDGTDYIDQKEQVELALQPVLEERRDLVAELDALLES